MSAPIDLAAHRRRRVADSTCALWGTGAVPAAYADALEQTCPTCHAAAGTPCRNPITGFERKIPCVRRLHP